MGGKKQQKKSLKAKIADLSTSYLRFVNMVVVAGGIGCLVLLFIVNPKLTWSGVGFLVLDIFVILSGAFGTIASGQTGCFSCHMFFLFISTSGLIAGFVCIFVVFDSAISSLSPTMSTYDAKQYLRAIGATYFTLFACQLVVLLLACMIQVCGFLEYYEDLDAISSAREVARMHQEDEERRARVVSTVSNPPSQHAHGNKLVEKMKAKYSQWTKKTPATDYDIENLKLDTEGAKSDMYTG